jgi:serine/threonine protein kinase
MLLQQSPFRGEDEDEIYDAILADEPLYPIHMPRDSVSILQKLLTREPELRLGSGPTDAQEIMSHAFFRNINWEDVRNLKNPPPFMPTIKNATDTSNFDSEFTSVTPVLTPVQSGRYCDPFGSNCANLLQSLRKPCRRSSGASLIQRTLSDLTFKSAATSRRGCFLTAVVSPTRSQACFVRGTAVRPTSVVALFSEVGWPTTRH